ncbi:hypothetical protein [Mesorhizobium sp.]|uniref:hypothetical protein n=1 Tax=Mesorhizobium sp. TaxID=1871066 RepID=UPI0025C14AD5|nr:hypothetical protein [Mesorhizobium sp.]
MIRLPRQQDEHPDREIDCQEAMEPGFQAIDKARAFLLVNLTAASNLAMAG